MGLPRQETLSQSFHIYNFQIKTFNTFSLTASDLQKGHVSHFVGIRPARARDCVFCALREELSVQPYTPMIAQIMSLALLCSHFLSIQDFFQIMKLGSTKGSDTFLNIIEYRSRIHSSQTNKVLN